MDKNTKEIKVLFNLRADSDWMGGVNYYRNLFLALNKTDNPKIVPYLYCRGDKASALSQFSKQASVKEKKNWKYYLSIILNKVFHTHFIPSELKSLKFDKYDLTSHCSNMIDSPGIQWIPDFQHLHLPDMFSKKEIEYRNRNFKKIAQDSDIVILSSYDALNDYKKFIPEYANKARVLHFVSYFDSKYYKETDNMIDSLLKKYSIPERFFYLPNQFWKHKNHKIVIDALYILKSKGANNIHIVCSGNTLDWRNPDYFDELIESIHQMGLSENIHILGMIDYKEVICLMRYSLALLQPSLFEGWSSTIEEAKSIGKNCILSNLPVHLEQNPSQSIFFDPNDANELAEILERANYDFTPGPNIMLEEKAKSTMDKRMKEFGDNYKKIVMEIC